jgi:hypothetical protein
MKVLGLSLITNKVVMDRSQTLHASHAEVLQNTQDAGKNVLELVKTLISREKLGAYLDALPDVDYKPKARNGGAISVNNLVFLGIVAFAGTVVVNFHRHDGIQALTEALRAGSKAFAKLIKQ